MVIINFLDGTRLELNSDTVLKGYKKSIDENGFKFNFEVDDLASNEANIPERINSQLEVVNFILSNDCFTLGLGNDKDTFYFSTSVKSVENSVDEHIAMPQIFGVPMNRN
ncbi:hypothetical protein [Paenibacillus sp. BAC0078]